MVNELIADLTKAKAIFQQRAILSAMGMVCTAKDMDIEQCAVCGDYHDGDIPLSCETGDGQ